jgi:BolA family transcriptional regulator, general stress-responsive regulator
MSMQSKLEEKLRSAFAPDELQVINESHLHAGHHHAESGHHGAFDGTGETHFRIKIVSQAFSGKSRIERHRAINALLADELKESIHALAIEATAPGKT